MASRGPAPFTQHKLSTLFIRVAWHEWPAVRKGAKREFRMAGTNPGHANVQTPTPAVLYAVNPRTRAYDARLMILEECRREPLGSISPESIKAEGFEDLAGFRRNWVLTRKRRFMPLRPVNVYVVAPWRPSMDEVWAGSALLNFLYGEWL
ncbi:MAG: hypothetical protein QOJ29_5020 [Thermoleophilaceae bacterium]|jgi:hypothetical protein|nr:hypothetical protein [Thermoleophilaceae bacterium]